MSGDEITVLSEFYVTVLQLLMMTLESSMGQLLHPLAQDHCLATPNSLLPHSPFNQLFLHSLSNKLFPLLLSNKLFPLSLSNKLFPLSPNNQQVLLLPFNQQVSLSPSNKLFPQKPLLAHQLSFHYHQF